MNRLSSRKSRAAIQVMAALTILAAVGVTLIDNRTARALSIALVGLVALLGTKIALVALINSNRMLGGMGGRTPLGTQTKKLTQQIDEIRPQLDDLTAELTRIAAENKRLIAEIEPLAMLTRRTEPAIAEFSTLRHEVLYLRETVSRLDRAGDVSQVG